MTNIQNPKTFDGEVRTEMTINIGNNKLKVVRMIEMPTLYNSYRYGISNSDEEPELCNVFMSAHEDIRDAAREIATAENLLLA